MFEAISDTTKIQHREVVPEAPLKPPSEVVKTKIKTAEEKLQEAAKERAPLEEKKSIPLTESLLKELEQDFDMIHNVGLQFSMHKGTGRTMVKVIDKDTDQLIREIPPEQILDLAAKLEEMVGILFDQTA